jgi:hypothetical protein
MKYGREVIEDDDKNNDNNNLLCIHQIHTSLGTHWIWNLSLDNTEILRIIQKYKINMPYQGTCHCHNHSNTILYEYKLRIILLLE